MVPGENLAAAALRLATAIVQSIDEAGERQVEMLKLMSPEQRDRWFKVKLNAMERVDETLQWWHRQLPAGDDG